MTPQHDHARLATHLVMIGQDAAPMLLCQQHLEPLVNILESSRVPYESFVLTGFDGVAADSGLDPKDHLCQACGLREDLAQPKIILPD